MIVKIIGPGNSFQLIDGVKRCSFARDGSEATAIIERDGEEAETHTIVGSAYVLNDDGKTIDSFHK